MNQRQKLTIMTLAACSLCLFTACAHFGDRPLSSPTDASYFDHVLNVYTNTLNHLSAVRRGVCPMAPSCSEYSRQAFSKHGFVKGWMMTMDRLMRCGRDEIMRAPKIYINGDFRYYDPIEANDNWWHSSRDDSDRLED